MFFILFSLFRVKEINNTYMFKFQGRKEKKLVGVVDIMGGKKEEDVLVSLYIVYIQ